MLPEPYVVTRVRRELHDTYSLDLEAQNGNTMRFKPGQFNMLYAFGVGEVPISMSSNPSESDHIIHTVREAGAVTRALCSLKKGSVIGIRGPFGSHWPIEAAYGNDIVIVTGGIGLAPLRPAIFQLIDQREKFGKFSLLYGSRTPSDLLFDRDLREWRRRFDMDVGVTVDSADGDWRGHVGVVTTLIPRAQFDFDNTIAFVCGPEIMMRFTITELRKRGITTDRIYISMERNMKCAIGLCGHCQFGPTFICKDGPVFRYSDVEQFFNIQEV